MWLPEGECIRKGRERGASGGTLIERVGLVPASEWVIEDVRGVEQLHGRGSAPRAVGGAGAGDG